MTAARILPRLALAFGGLVLGSFAFGPGTAVAQPPVAAVAPSRSSLADDTSPRDDTRPASRPARVRFGVNGAIAIGGAEAQRRGGFMAGGAVNIRLGVQFDDLIALYYEAGAYVGAGEGPCNGRGSCGLYGIALHTSSALLDLTFDWFQVAAGPAVVIGFIDGREARGLGGKVRLMYVGGGDEGRERSGFTMGGEVMVAAFLDGCFAQTVQLSVGHEWY